VSEVESVPIRSKFRSLNNKTVFLEICLNTRSIATKPMPSLSGVRTKPKASYSLTPMKSAACLMFRYSLGGAVTAVSIRSRRSKIL